LSDNRLPRFISATKIQDSLSIKSFNGDPKYQIYISGRILTTSPFVPGNAVNLYNANAQATGQISIDNIITNDDLSDNFNDYTIIEGRLTTGNFIGALTIGDAGNRQEFQDFSILDGNTFQVAELESDSGTANLRLGRKDGIQSSPGVYFNSSQLVANYNAAIIASGGNATDGSGTLNAQVANANGFTINGNTIWNAGNITFQSTNVANTGVKRDASGNFSAGTITASLTGAASLNVLKAGDTMTGSLSISGAGSNLSVQGTSLLTGVVTMVNDLAVDTDTLFVDVSTDRVGVNAGVAPAYNLDVRGDLGLGIYSVTNATGAKITFSDQTTSYAQKGFFSFYHADSTIANSSRGSYFIFDSTEATMGVKFGSAASPAEVYITDRLGIQTDDPQYPLDVAGAGRIRGTLYLDNAADNSGAPIQFLGSSSYRNFQVGNQIVANNLFTIQASTAGGGTTWNTTPAFSIDGSTNRISINTTATSGVDPTSNTTRNYQLNVQGDINLNGSLYQNNEPFVTSRWTEASNGADIYRLSRVGINKADPTYHLHVLGSANIEGQDFVSNANNRVLYANGDKQWIDTYGIFKSNRNTINENITIPANVNSVSAGPITINNGVTVIISNGSSWSVV